MWRLLLGVVVAGSPLLVGELLARLLGLKQEYARKTVHVLGGVASASLVLFLSLSQVALLGALFCLVLCVVRRYRLVSALYQINRPSYGEIFFPAGVSLAAALAPSALAFVLAMLIAGFADTAASLAGRRYAQARRLPSGNKSVPGSLAFLLVAALILAVASSFSLPQVFLTAGAVAVIEALSMYGSDNLTVPLATIFCVRLILV